MPAATAKQRFAAFLAADRPALVDVKICKLNEKLLKLVKGRVPAAPKSKSTPNTT
jgi:hypothetical protein